MPCFRFLTCLFLLGQISLAQQAVQQPVVGTSTVSTSVSVPDRGRAFLGGVSSAESGRSQYGPLRTGPATGLATQASSMTVSVYIHDLHEMDEAILNSVPSTTAASRSKTEGATTAIVREIPLDPALKVAKYEQLARKADDDGRFGVARLHWQMAAKYGSKAAKERLAELPQASSVRPNQASTR